MVRVPGKVVVSWASLASCSHFPTPKEVCCFGFACGVSQVDTCGRGTLWCPMASSLAYDFSWYFGTARTDSLGNFNNNNPPIRRMKESKSMNNGVKIQLHKELVGVQVVG